MESRISIISLGVSDLANSTAFYRNGLGLKLRDNESNSYISFFQLNSFLLALYPSELLAADAGVPHQKSVFSGITLAHNVGSKKEVDDILESAYNANAVITKSAEIKSWGGYSGYFKDPDGYLWEIAWNPSLVVDNVP